MSLKNQKKTKTTEELVKEAKSTAGSNGKPMLNIENENYYLVLIPDEKTVPNSPNQMIVTNEVKLFLEMMCSSEIDSSLRRVFRFNNLKFFMVSESEAVKNKK